MAVYPAPAGGRGVRYQPKLPVLPGSESGRAQAQRPQAGRWRQSSPSRGGKAECPLALDFGHDEMVNGRLFRILNVVDDVTQECLTAIPDTTTSVQRVVRGLTALFERRRQAGLIVSNNGSDLTPHPIFDRVKDQWIEWQYIMPVKTMQNDYVESFSGKKRDKLLNETLFFSLNQTRAAVAEWIEDYNTQDHTLRRPTRRPRQSPRNSLQEAGTLRPSGAPHANLLLDPPQAKA